MQFEFYIGHCLEHEFGHDAVDITELFVQDTKVKVRVPGCFAPETVMSVKQSADEAGAEKDDALRTTEPSRGDSTELLSLDEDDEDIEDGFDEEQEIQDRCDAKAKQQCG